MNKIYKTIVADPPWLYNSKKTGGSMASGSCQKYKVLDIEDIARLNVDEVTDDSSVLLLWVTVPLFPEGLYVLQNWHFKYKGALTWVKTGRLGMGYWWRNNFELCLLGTRKQSRPFRSSLRNVIMTKPGKHSEKPKEFFELVNKITPEPRLELFARTKRDGWDAWGNEVNSDIELSFRYE